MISKWFEASQNDFKVIQGLALLQSTTMVTAVYSHQNGRSICAWGAHVLPSQAKSLRNHLLRGLKHFETTFWSLESFWNHVLRAWITWNSLFEALNHFEITFWRLESLWNHFLRMWFKSGSSLQKVISNWFKASRSDFKVSQSLKSESFQSDSRPQNAISKWFKPSKSDFKVIRGLFQSDSGPDITTVHYNGHYSLQSPQWKEYL